MTGEDVRHCAAAAQRLVTAEAARHAYILGVACCRRHAVAGSDGSVPAVTGGDVAPQVPTPSPTTAIDGPTIVPLTWTPPSAVLGPEASGFTPWLSRNLDVIGRALGLDQIELVDTEIDVAGKRLDILAAVAGDATGTIGLAIEGQYGTSDHDHLGKLVTYAAGTAATYDRVLCVWLVDEAHAAHEAAIELLNRETSDRLGFVLARVRFVAAGESRWAVDVDVVAQPNEFLREQQLRVQATNPDRYQFLAEVLDIARQPLLEMGYSSVAGPDRTGYAFNIRWPRDSRWFIDVRGGKPNDGFLAYVYVNGEATTEANELILSKIAAHAELVEAEVAVYGATLDWAAHTRSRLARVAALGLCAWPGVGYESEPSAAAERLIAFCRGVAEAARAAGM